MATRPLLVTICGQFTDTKYRFDSQQVKKKLIPCSSHVAKRRDPWKF